MSVSSEKQAFKYKLVPLSNIGFTKGTGSQTLGLEVQQATSLGTEVTIGVRGDRTDLDNEYLIENTNTARAYIRVSQGLFRQWGKKYNLASLQMAEFRYQIQNLENERQRQDLIRKTAQLYYQQVLAKQLIERSKKALSRSKEHLEAAKSRQSIGLVSKVDVYRAELAFLNVENDLQDQLKSARRNRDLFIELLGMNADESLQIDSSLNWIHPIVPDRWEEALLANRLDWQVYRLKSSRAQLAFYKAQRDTQPDLRLSVRVEQKGEGEHISSATNLDETNWSLQLQLFSSIERFNEKNALTRERLNKGKLRREGDTLKRKIFREAQEAFEDLKTRERYYQISIKRMEQATNVLELTRTRYKRGLSAILDVLDSENAFSEAELDIVRNIIAYNNTAIQLAYSLGVLDLEWLQGSLDAVLPEIDNSSQASTIPRARKLTQQ